MSPDIHILDYLITLITQPNIKCNYPAWSVHKVRQNMWDYKGKGTKKTSQKKDTSKNRNVATVCYVKGLSKTFTRILKAGRICAAVKPHTALRNCSYIPKTRLWMRKSLRWCTEYLV